MAGEARRDEIRKIHKEYKWHYVVIAVVVALGIGIWIGAAVFADDSSGYAMNLVTEGFGVAVSVVITVFVIDRINWRRDEMRRIEEMKRRLVLEASSQSNDLAISAIEELREKGWQEGDDGLLCGVTLHRTNLSSAHLEGANLQGATLVYVNLENANLDRANLQGATFHKVNLRHLMAWKSDCQGTDFGLNTRLTGAAFGFANLKGSRLSYCWINDTILPGVNLKDADLQHSNLNRADLYDANLQGANLSGASLMGARLTSATLDAADFSNARLPDGSIYSGDTDTNRFTDTGHPDYKSTSERVNLIRKSLELNS